MSEDEARIAELERRVRALEIVLIALCGMDAVWLSEAMWPAMEHLGFDLEEMRANRQRKNTT